MKAKIKAIEYIKDYDSKFGKMYSFWIKYDEKKAIYSCKKREQDKFKIGEEAEFVEEEKEGKNGKYLVIKPMQNNSYSPYNKAVKKEQSRYSGFAVSYAKDLCIAGKIEFKDISQYSTVLFNLMVSLDKTLEA